MFHYPAVNSQLSNYIITTCEGGVFQQLDRDWFEEAVGFLYVDDVQ